MPSLLATQNLAIDTSDFDEYTQAAWFEYFLGTVFIVFGLCSALAGRKLFPYVMSFLAGLAAFVGIVLLFTSFEWPAWSGYVVGVLAGVAAGFFMYKSIRVMILAAGGFLGYVAGFFLFSLVFVGIFGVESSIWFWVCTIGCAALVGFLSFRFSGEIVLLATSIIGSYAVMRGGVYFWGGFPTEAEVYNSWAAGVSYDFDATAWYYIAFFIVFSLLSIFWQSKRYTSTHPSLESSSYYTKSRYERV